jgi:hypothetical protein
MQPAPPSAQAAPQAPEESERVFEGVYDVIEVAAVSISRTGRDRHDGERPSAQERQQAPGKSRR